MDGIQPQEINPSPESESQVYPQESMEVESMSPEASQAKQTIWQAVKFTLFSASAGIIQLATFELLDKVILPPHGLAYGYEIAYGIALVLSVLWNFTFNRRYTFRSDMNVPKAMLLVFAYYLVFAPLSIWLGGVLTRNGANADLVFVGTMLVNFITEYLFQRFVVYKNAIDTNDVAQKAQAKAKSRA